jgi:pilus assembly protein CpaF
MFARRTASEELPPPDRARKLADRITSRRAGPPAPANGDLAVAERPGRLSPREERLRQLTEILTAGAEDDEDRPADGTDDAGAALAETATEAGTGVEAPVAAGAGARAPTGPDGPGAGAPCGPKPAAARPCGPQAAGRPKARLPGVARFVAPPTQRALSDTVVAIKDRVQGMLVERIDTASAARLPREQLKAGLSDITRDILVELQVHLNGQEHGQLVDVVMDEMLGLGPLEPLLADDTVTDIMVNRFDRVYVERRGKIELTDVVFRDHQHVFNIASRIVNKIGRRIDESHPLCDARLEDGSRVNIVIPPLSIDGPSMSIRKFAKRSITFERMIEQSNLSDQMATVLKTAARSRLNILISGGTGSGKTTLLNACSQMIDPQERVVTIEDAAELQLQQDHVLRMETRTANLEGKGEVTMRDLVKNALRMRPDRIILGEVRGGEVFDMLQAMNTGHEGSMSTIHANRPREALTRLENMVAMAGFQLPVSAVRMQISSAVDMIVQISRMRDGMRRITSITEVTGMEGDVITTQELFRYEYDGEDPSGKLRGRFVPSGLRPHFTEKARYYGLEQALIKALG